MYNIYIHPYTSRKSIPTLINVPVSHLRGLENDMVHKTYNEYCSNWRDSLRIHDQVDVKLCSNTNDWNDW